MIRTRNVNVKPCTGCLPPTSPCRPRVPWPVDGCDARTGARIGARKPSFDNLRLLADTLDVTTDYLLGRVAEFKALAGADTLHRHYSALKDEDRKFADDLITHLANRATTRKK